MRRNNKNIAGCTGKRRYSSEDDADKVAKAKTCVDTTLNLRSYPCRHCKCWHITSRANRIEI